MNRHDGSTAYAYPYGEVAEINKSVGPIFTNHAFNHKENEHLAIYPPHSGIPAPVPTTPYVCYTGKKAISISSYRLTVASFQIKPLPIQLCPFLSMDTLTVSNVILLDITLGIN